MRFCRFKNAGARHVILGAAVIGAATAVGAPAFAGVRPSVVMASGTTSISGSESACSLTNPEYLIHAGRASLNLRPGSTWFHATHIGANGYWEDPYMTAGYNGGLGTAYYCDGREIPGSGGQYGQAYALPVKIGKQGHIVATVKDWTSSAFRGDSGFDIWFEPSASDTSYAQMVNGGDASTEIMIWLNHPGLRVQSSSLRYYRTRIDGRWWRVEVGKASAGHGRTASHPRGWTVVNFIAPQYTNGNVTVHNLVLNSFGSYAIAHGWLRASDYWMGINNGFEMTQGSATAESFTMTGAPRT